MRVRRGVHGDRDARIGGEDVGRRVGTDCAIAYFRGVRNLRAGIRGLGYPHPATRGGDGQEAAHGRHEECLRRTGLLNEGGHACLCSTAKEFGKAKRSESDGLRLIRLRGKQPLVP